MKIKIHTCLHFNYCLTTVIKCNYGISFYLDKLRYERMNVEQLSEIFENKFIEYYVRCLCVTNTMWRL